MSTFSKITTTETESIYSMTGIYTPQLINDVGFGFEFTINSTNYAPSDLRVNYTKIITTIE